MRGRRVRRTRTASPPVWGVRFAVGFQKTCEMHRRDLSFEGSVTFTFLSIFLPCLALTLIPGVPVCERAGVQDLKAVASQALAFSTDEDGADSSGMNPFASVFDLGKEPMDYWEDRVCMHLLTVTRCFAPRWSPR